MDAQAIMLIDGECMICSSVVAFTIPRDPKGRIQFATLQSESGQRLLAQRGLPKSDFKSFVFILNGVALTKSAAVVNYFSMLRGPWPLLKVFLIVPKPIRDYLYDVVAANRYRWFGKRETCLLPTDDIRQRFLL